MRNYWKISTHLVAMAGMGILCPHVLAQASATDAALEEAKGQVVALPGQTMGATLQVIFDLKKSNAAKAVTDWLDPVHGEKPSMSSSVVGPGGALFDAPVNGQMTVTAPLVAAAAAGTDGGLALPAANLLAREQGMVGGLTAAHTQNAVAEDNLSKFMDSNLGVGQGPQVIGELHNLDRANIAIALGMPTAGAAGAKKVQLEALLSGQFDTAIARATIGGGLVSLPVAAQAPVVASSASDPALEQAKAQVATLPGQTMGATLQVIFDLKKSNAAKAVTDWLDPVYGEKPSMSSSVVGPGGALFDAPVNGQMTVTAPLVAAAAAGTDGGLALPAVNLLAREQGMVGGLTAVHSKNQAAEDNLSKFMEINLSSGQGQEVINELRNLDTANKTIAIGSATPLGAIAAAKKVQLETLLSGQFDTAIVHATM